MDSIDKAEIIERVEIIENQDFIVKALLLNK
jgi:hypothetical protein